METSCHMSNVYVASVKKHSQQMHIIALGEHFGHCVISLQSRECIGYG
jgi:hypothetical protein